MVTLPLLILTQHICEDASMSIASIFSPRALTTAAEKLYCNIFLPPNLKLKIRGIPKPNFFLIITVIVISAYCIFSGIFYDIINNPPSIGQAYVYNHFDFLISFLTLVLTFRIVTLTPHTQLLLHVEE